MEYTEQNIEALKEVIATKFSDHSFVEQLNSEPGNKASAGAGAGNAANNDNAELPPMHSTKEVYGEWSERILAEKGMAKAQAGPQLHTPEPEMEVRAPESFVAALLAQRGRGKGQERSLGL